MIANPLLRSGFQVLLRTNGENLSFRGTTVRAVVNRNPFDRVVRTPDFDPRDASEIRLFMSAVDAKPRAGEQFVDENAVGHRVQTVKSLHDVHTCTCQSCEVGTAFATDFPELILTEAREPLLLS